MLPDDVLLDFDLSRLEDGDTLDPRALLAQHGDLYRNHLSIARWVEGWRERHVASGVSERRSEEFDAQNYALGEIAAHLRQGDFLPGGGLYGDITSLQLERDFKPH